MPQQIASTLPEIQAIIREISEKIEQGERIRKDTDADRREAYSQLILDVNDSQGIRLLSRAVRNESRALPLLLKGTEIGHHLLVRIKEVIALHAHELNDAVELQQEMDYAAQFMLIYQTVITKAARRVTDEIDFLNDRTPDRFKRCYEVWDEEDKAVGALLAQESTIEQKLEIAKKHALVPDIDKSEYKKYLAQATNASLTSMSLGAVAALVPIGTGKVILGAVQVWQAVDAFYSMYKAVTIGIRGRRTKAEELPKQSALRARTAVVEMLLRQDKLRIEKSLEAKMLAKPELKALPKE